MMMNEPPVTPALPTPATARLNHMQNSALTIQLRYGGQDRLKEDRSNALTPMINASDVSAVAQMTEPTSKTNNAARKLYFRLKALYIFPKHNWNAHLVSRYAEGDLVSLGST
jgi:hypothetical protein